MDDTRSPDDSSPDDSSPDDSSIESPNGETPNEPDISEPTADEPPIDSEEAAQRNLLVRQKLVAMYGDASPATVRQFLHDLTRGDADVDPNDVN